MVNMRSLKQHYILFIFCFSFMACNTSQKDQLEQINNSLITLKEALNKNQKILIKSTSSRYQLVQSTLAARYTFKIDTYEGKVYQLVVDSNNNESWKLLKRTGNSNRDRRIDGQRNYELFLSPLAMKFTYLINTNTGATWQFVLDSETKENLFEALIE